ncbi:hypothetical protein [Leptothoe spongobia]|uniref:Uncharacterized protein n=1 Tax=Leptothoe spongobia TAU-MAC 1115 TaxID=1967444 RepID=A0A947GIT9_9CYAN|nr:hypothetical protein [Leptothoe spongobia]MBT9315463.1 hypothetical protein [Leptothoe spongobia TAU-MAC 1115]
MPPSVKPIVKDSTSRSGRVPKRRLFSLIATAAVASGLGVTLGSTLRFQVLPVGQAPLFQPQQDFPPLAEWPPQVPDSTEHEDFDVDWDDEMPQSQLVYNEAPISSDVEAYDEVDADLYQEKTDVLKEPVLLEDSPIPISGTLGDEDVTQDITDEAFEEEALPPVVAPNIGEPDSEVDSQPLEITDSVTESYPWFDKRPVSESQFTDGPVIISPDGPVPSPDLLSD